MKNIVLVVDDNPNNLQLISSVLNPYYQLLLANNGESAIKTAEVKFPDLILLDIMMPGKNGYDVCKILKENEKTKEIPIIFLTAKAEEEDIALAYEVGGVDYITKPFKAKEMLARIKTQIELKDINERLQIQNDELKVLVANRDKFFSIIAHNLRSPFNALLNVSQMLIEEKDAIGAQEKDIMIENIYNGSETAFTLVEDLILWVRLQTGLIPFNPELFSLGNALDNIIISYEKYYESKQISVHTNYEDFNQQVFFDKDAFEQVIGNLLSNAVKFSNEGGAIQIGFKQKENKLYIYVKDNGVGIPQKIQSKLFKIEENTSARGTKNEKGSGLGLIICKELVELNYGEFGFESSEQSGTTFYILLNYVPFNNILSASNKPKAGAL